MPELFCEKMQVKHVIFTQSNAHLVGSTDMGNVSQVIPCINPSFDIGTRAPHYSKAFQEAAGSETAHGMHTFQDTVQIFQMELLSIKLAEF